MNKSPGSKQSFDLSEKRLWCKCQRQSIKRVEAVEFEAGVLGLITPESVRNQVIHVSTLCSIPGNMQHVFASYFTFYTGFS